MSERTATWGAQLAEALNEARGASFRLEPQADMPKPFSAPRAASESDGDEEWAIMADGAVAGSCHSFGSRGSIGSAEFVEGSDDGSSPRYGSSEDGGGLGSMPCCCHGPAGSPGTAAARPWGGQLATEETSSFRRPPIGLPPSYPPPPARGSARPAVASPKPVCCGSSRAGAGPGRADDDAKPCCGQTDGLAQGSSAPDRTGITAPPAVRDAAAPRLGGSDTPAGRREAAATGAGAGLGPSARVGGDTAGPDTEPPLLLIGAQGEGAARGDQRGRAPSAQPEWSARRRPGQGFGAQPGGGRAPSTEQTTTRRLRDMDPASETNTLRSAASFSFAALRRGRPPLAEPSDRRSMALRLAELAGATYASAYSDGRGGVAGGSSHVAGLSARAVAAAAAGSCASEAFRIGAAMAAGGSAEPNTARDSWAEPTPRH